MVELWLPYGNTEVPVRIPDGYVSATIQPADFERTGDAQNEILATLRQPKQDKILQQLLDPADKVTIVIEDTKEVLPIESLLTPVLSELESLGIKSENTSVLFAWTDRGSIDTPERRRKPQEQFAEKAEISFHDPATTKVAQLESTSSGTHLGINETYVKSDFRIVIGEVRFDNLTGYKGFGTSIVPGLADTQTIREIWSLALEGRCGRGIFQENPLSREITEASKIAGVDFALNIVLGKNNEVSGVFGGSLENSFSEAVQLVDHIWKRPVDRRADIAVVSAGGAPFDSHFYWATDSIDTVTPVLQDEGSIVLVAECRVGTGSKELERCAQEHAKMKDIRKAVKREMTPAGYKSLRLREVMEQHRITLISAMPDFFSRKTFGLGTAKTVNDALISALRRHTGKANILVVPQGTSTMPYYSTA